MENEQENLARSLFSEILMTDQLARAAVARVMPKGMELSHFVLLNHLSSTGQERSPAQLAKTFHLTRGAMTNTLSKLEWQGFVHIRPDWDDARRKMVTISPAGRRARDSALALITPVIGNVVEIVGADKVRDALPVIRAMRRSLSEQEKD
jgi:DNA-binding MarR family transcriptional regulator